MKVDPQLMLYILMFMESATKALLRQLNTMTEEELDEFIAKEEAEKVLNDIWLEEIDEDNSIELEI